MSSVNKVILIGNMGADPEMNTTGSGVAVCNISLATSSFVKDEEKTEWHRVTLWDKTAENVAKYMKKGSKLYVEGRLQTRSYEDKEGNTRYQTEVVAERVAFLDSKPAGDKPAAKEAQKPTRGGRKAKPADDDFGF
jgi:single-strand DNA-binding protein